MNEQKNENFIIKKRKKWVIPFAISFIVIILVAIFIAFFTINSSGKDSELQAQLDLGDKYLSELDYEQAIVAYETAIEIDPMSVDAYLSLASVYESQGDYDKATSVLEEGYEATGDEKLNQRLEEINFLRTIDEQPTEELFSDSNDSLPVIIKSEGTSYNSEGICTGTSLIEYHLNGETASIINYKDGSILSEEHYNEDGNLISAVQRSVNEWEGAVKDEIIFNGTEGWSTTTELKRISYYADGSSVVVREGIVDDEGKIIASNTFSKDGSLQSSQIIEYDTQNNVVWIYENHLTQEKTLSMVYHYDDNGNLVEVLHYNFDGTLYMKDISLYNDDNEEVEYISYDNAGKITSKYSYEYNFCGHFSCVTYCYYDSDGNINYYSRSETEFDEHGNPIRTNDYDQEDNLISYTVYTNYYQ